MAIAYTATILGYDYGFDFEDQRIDIDVDIERLNVESLYRAIQEAQASEVGIAFREIATASGLDELAEGITTFITVKLLENWEINTLRVTGKFEVAGGNLIRDDGEDPFRDNPLITYINYISQAGVRATFSTGTGLSEDEHNKLMGLPDETFDDDDRTTLEGIADETFNDDDRTTLEGIATDQADQLTEDRFKKLNFNKVNMVSGGLINNYRPNNEFGVAVTRDGDNVPTAETIVP